MINIIKRVASAAISIGSSIVDGTVGSVLFITTGGKLGQDNDNFFWDDTNKRLGVGTKVPEKSLDVRGTIRVDEGTPSDPSIHFTSEPGTGIYQASLGEMSFAVNGIKQGAISGDSMSFAANKFKIRNDTNYNYIDSYNGSTYSNKMAIHKVTGKTGIGTTAPDANLEVQTASAVETKFRLRQASQNSWDFKIPSGQTRLDIGDVSGDYVSILSSGNIGIGTKVPVSKLEVNGSKGTKVTTVSTATPPALGANDSFISVTHTTTGPVTIPLPSAASAWNSTDKIGRVYTISDSGANAGTNNIIINRAGSDTIVTSATAQTSAIISGNGDVIRIIAINSTTWKVF